MKKEITIIIVVDDKNPKLCGKCDYLASDCTIFGMLKGTWKKPIRHKDCLKNEK